MPRAQEAISPQSSFKINPVTHSSCCRRQALAFWEQPQLHHRTRASGPFLPLPQATARPPIQALQVVLQQESTLVPQPDPVRAALRAPNYCPHRETTLHRGPSKATALHAPCLGSGDQRRIFPSQ